MDSELEEVTCKFAWFNLACARDELDAAVALLAELKVHSGSRSTSAFFPLYRGFSGVFFLPGEEAIFPEWRGVLMDV